MPSDEAIPEIGETWLGGYRLRLAGAGDPERLVELRSEFEADGDCFGLNLPTDLSNGVYVIEHEQQIVGMVVLRLESLDIVYVSPKELRKGLATIAVGILLENFFSQHPDQTLSTKPITKPGGRFLKNLFNDDRTDVDRAHWLAVVRDEVIRKLGSSTRGSFL